MLGKSQRLLGLLQAGRHRCGKTRFFKVERKRERRERERERERGREGGREGEREGGEEETRLTCFANTLFLFSFASQQP